MGVRVRACACACVCMFVCVKKIPYASIIGSLMYAMICKKSYIAHVDGVVSHFISNSGKDHLQVVK